MTRCAWRDVQTGELVCLRTDRHDCEVRKPTKGRGVQVFVPRREFGRAW
jgi:hypothetical protein